MTAESFAPTTFPKVDDAQPSALAALTGLDMTVLDDAYDRAGVDAADRRNILDDAVAGLVATHVGRAMERLELAERAIIAERDAVGVSSNGWHMGARAAFAQAADIVSEARS